MSVSVVKTGAGDFSIGAEIEGVFVPFATLSGGRVAQLVERGKNLEALAKGGNENAKAQLGTAISSAAKAEPDSPKQKGNG